MGSDHAWGFVFELGISEGVEGGSELPDEALQMDTTAPLDQTVYVHVT